MNSDLGNLVETLVINEIPESSEVYFLCNYRDSNIGDSAIAHATFELLDRNQFKYRIFLPYSLPYLNKRKIASRLNRSNVTILLPGGGNFGGLYPWNDRHRVWCLDNLPKARIIQLPQSIHFVSTKQELRIKKSFEAHGNAKILVRDLQSLNRIIDWEVEKSLVPDLVEILPIRSNLGTTENGCLVREDNESVGGINLDQLQTSFDWPRISLFSRATYRCIKFINRIFPSKYSESFEWNSRSFLKAKKFHGDRTEIGLLLLENYSNLQTDRLHGLLLGRKASCKVVFSDNSTRKISAYFETWYI